MTMSKAMHAMALFLLVLAAACGSTAPKERYFTLAAPDRGGPPPASDQPSIFVGPVSVPDAVDRTQMVLITGPNQVDVSDDDRWAELPRNAIASTVAQILGRELGTSRVFSSRAASGTPVDYRVSIEVRRFDSSLAEGATIDAVWTVTSPSGPARNGHAFAHEPAASHDPAGVAAAHGRALERITREIARSIREAR
ncbi:MAG TPA: PqiC family protein [Usitatibacter sp.]|jgi:hypothetical protein|nr:PqiC family protein [Usitatibacter sp.]